MADADPGIPLPSQIPAAPSSTPKPMIHPKTVVAALASLPSNTDAFLGRLQKCISTPSGTDAILLFLCYGSKFLSQVLASASITTLHHRARQLVALALSFPPGKAAADALLAPASAAGLPAGLMALSTRLKALSGMLSDVRAFSRLWGLLGMYFWAKRLMTASPSSSSAPAKTKPVDAAIAYGSLASCVMLQGMENVAYLGSKGVLPVSPKRQGELFRWSSRFWALYVGLDLARLLRELVERRNGRQDRKVASAKAAAENMDPAAAAEAGTSLEGEEREWLVRWRKNFLKQAAWMPVTVHYSKATPLLSEAAIGLLGSIPGVMQAGDLWREAGKSA